MPNTLASSNVAAGKVGMVIVGVIVGKAGAAIEEAAWWLLLDRPRFTTHKHVKPATPRHSREPGLWLQGKARARVVVFEDAAMAGTLLSAWSHLVTLKHAEPFPSTHLMRQLLEPIPRICCIRIKLMRGGTPIPTAANDA